MDARTKPRIQRTNSKGLKLDPRRLLAAHENKIDFEILERFAGRSVISALQFGREEIIELCKLSALLEISEIATYHPLDGTISVTAFFEASTRTRLSFESAVNRLDGRLLSVPDGKVTGVAKGESLSDIGEMFNTYADLVIMRHPSTEGIDEIRKNLLLPLINAGNGSGEHPSQALTDWYALLKWRPEFAREDVDPNRKIHLGVLGTPGNMRAVKSFVFMSLAFENAIKKVTIVSEMADPLGEELSQAVEKSPIPFEFASDPGPVLPELDVIYMNSIALLGDSYRQLDSAFRLDTESHLEKDAVIMHPLARRDELDESLDDTSHNLYFAQAAGAVFLRQALLMGVLDRWSVLPPSILYLAS